MRRVAERAKTSTVDVGPAKSTHTSGSIDNDSDDGDDDAGALSLSQILALKEQFDASDTDGGGSLDIDEFSDAFGKVLESSGGKLEGLQIERLFMQIDANSDGGVDWNEFSNYMLLESQANQSEPTEHVSNFFLHEKVGPQFDRSEGDWHTTSTSCIVLDNGNNVYITAAKERPIRLWSQSTLSMVKIVQSPDWVYAMCVIGGTKSLCTSCADRRIRLYDMHSWECIFEIECGFPAVSLCTWRSREDDMLAYGDDKGRITVANVTREFEKRKTDPRLSEKARLSNWTESSAKYVHNGWVHQIKKVDDLGCLVSCGSDSSIVIFDFPFRADSRTKDRIQPKRVLKDPRGHMKGVKCFVWIKSQKVIVSGGLERSIVTWNPYTGKPISILTGHTLGIEQLEVVPQFDKLVSMSTDGVIKVWDLPRSECVQTINPIDSFTRPSAFVFDPARSRLVVSCRRPYIWTINPRVLLPTSQTSHRSPVVAVLFNRIHGQLVTVAEDTETVIWRVGNGQRIFSYFDTERDEDAPLSCANFDEAGRRLMTGDHEGKVRVWNFNNGGCLRVLEKERDENRRDEVTDVVNYAYDDKRFIAVTGWDRRLTVWLDEDDKDDTLMSVEAHDTDIVSVVFTQPKNLITTALDGSIHIFDIESGAKKGSLAYPGIEGSKRKVTFAEEGGTAFVDIMKTNYIERIRVLKKKGGALVSIGTDGCLCFWDGSSFRLMLTLAARHKRGFGLVGLQTDTWNRFLVTADQGGYVKLWSIEKLNFEGPSESQVRPLVFWQAHQSRVASLDLVPLPKAGENASHFVVGDQFSDHVVVTASLDRRVLVWSLDAVCVGQLGQEREWSLDDKTSWQSSRSSRIPMEEEEEDQEMNDGREAGDAEEEVDILQLLDERLQKRHTSKGLLVVPIEEVADTAKKSRRREYTIDPLTGERIYQSNEKKNLQSEERRRLITPYLKGFMKKLDPDNLV